MEQQPTLLNDHIPGFGERFFFFFFFPVGEKNIQLTGKQDIPKARKTGKKRISKIFQKPQTIILSVLDEENAEFHNLLQQRTGVSTCPNKGTMAFGIEL